MRIAQMLDDGLRTVEEGTPATDSYEVRRMLQWLSYQLIVQPMMSTILESFEQTITNQIIGAGYSRRRNIPPEFALHGRVVMPITMHLTVGSGRPLSSLAQDKVNGLTLAETIRKNADG